MLQTRNESQFATEAKGCQLIEAVAIDGPAASGKTAVGKLVAERLGYRFLDTGLLYRAATWVVLSKGIDLDDRDEIASAIRRTHIELKPEGLDSRLLIDEEDITDALRTPEIDRTVSIVSAIPEVRRALMPHQRIIAEVGPVVMAGRDIGTVILADARSKVFLDAAVEIRAARRYSEMTGSGTDGIGIEQVAMDTARRDEIDTARSDSPLSAAQDATVIRTDSMSLVEVVDCVIDLVEGR